MAAVAKSALLNSLPSEWPSSLLPVIQAQVQASGRTVVVLDDDPTGTQTVHNVPVLTDWPVQALASELANNRTCFYILTNSRSMALPDAQALNAEIAANLIEAGRQTRKDFVVISRSDSTLRGHYPGEVDSLVRGLERSFDATLLIPFFLEGGRYTLDNVHYVAEGDLLIPAGETPFAQDAVFGYRASNLCQWVEEKTGAQVRAGTVASVSLDDIRLGGPAQVTRRLLDLSADAVCVVNAASYRDLEVFVAGLLDAESQGKRFVYRTAASFVRVRAGLDSHALLTADDLRTPGTGGGLFVVGSYVPKSTRQLQYLLDETDIHRIELPVTSLLDEEQQRQLIATVAGRINTLLSQGEDVVVFTSRHLVTGSDAEQNLSIGQRVSDSLIALVQAISVRPDYVLAKGGITSSDVATKGLGIKRAVVAGQILPGVPVWQCGPESRYPGLPYIVFPGNVGDESALVDIYRHFHNRNQTAIHSGD